MHSDILTIQGLTFGYPGRDKVFKNASARIRAGELVVLEGPSGAGKSTLLRLLCRLEEPLAGTIAMYGEPLAAMNPVRLRRRICYIQQTPTVVEGSVRRNLLLPFGFKANSDLEVPSDTYLRQRLEEFLLHGVTLEQPASALSVGQRQRICVLRSLLLWPEVMLFDEPTSALDKESAAVVMRAAHSLHAQGVTILLVTHALEAGEIENAVPLRVNGRKLER
jgi:putative ABC transport system ATP-binding protein